MEEQTEYIKKLVNNLFADLVAKYKLKFGDISPLQDLKVQEFEKLLNEWVNQNNGVE